LLKTPVVAQRDRSLASRATLFRQEQGVRIMLVLSRKVGERIHVGNDIVLEVRRISGNRVTIALEAPRDVRILRGELERAAREFEPQPNGQSETTSEVPTSVTAARLNVAEHLAAAHPVSQDYAV
jgi:carbon storage regulator CsrA